MLGAGVERGNGLVDARGELVDARSQRRIGDGPAGDLLDCVTYGLERVAAGEGFDPAGQLLETLGQGGIRLGPVRELRHRRAQLVKRHSIGAAADGVDGVVQTCGEVVDMRRQRLQPVGGGRVALRPLGDLGHGRPQLVELGCVGDSRHTFGKLVDGRPEQLERIGIGAARRGLPQLLESPPERLDLGDQRGVGDGPRRHRQLVERAADVVDR